MSTENRHLTIAIDGTSGSGKSTAAKNLASVLGIEYIDTGAMYRAAAYKALKENVPVDDDHAVGDMLSETEIDFVRGRILLDGEDISDRIRTLEISHAASKISQLASCRAKLVEIQRRIASQKSVVMDGRDIGTNVLSGASHKFYVTASLETRAERRLAELLEKGEQTTYEEVLEDLKARDHSDMTRKLNPLVRAEDAIDISTDECDIEGTLQCLLQHIGVNYAG